MPEPTTVETQVVPTSAAPVAGASADLEARLAAATKELADTRKEAAGYRTKLNAKEEAELSDLQKAQKRVVELEAADQAKEAKFRNLNLRLAVSEVGSKLGLIDPELASLAISGRVEYDDAGTPKNVDSLLTELSTSKTHLFGGTKSVTTTPVVVGGSPANPGKGATSPSTFTRAQLGDRNFYLANKAAIEQASREGRIT